ncbi:MAG: SPOR domain-containing protein [Flavobacteriaceae bacterium]|nr:SPOR domain-containing protein [Flavobacteriaceae bacterium]
MKIHPFFLLTVLLFSSFISSAQESKEIDAIMNKKRLYNKNHPFGDGFKIQIYNGNETEAYEFKDNYDLEFNDVAELSYEAPEWKVRVGNFYSRLEADRALLTIKQKFSGAIVLETKILR